MGERVGERKGTEEETVKRLAELRAYLERRIQELEEQVGRMKTFLEVVGEVLAAKSFRRAELVPAVKYEQVIPLKTAGGKLLANMYVGDSDARIVPAEDVKFDVATPPLQSFLIKRVLESMEAKDREASQRGEITPDKVISYEVVQEGDEIREILIRNYGDERRLREIKTSTRWTLEKMYERTERTG